MKTAGRWARMAEPSLSHLIASARKNRFRPYLVISTLLFLKISERETEGECDL